MESILFWVKIGYHSRFNPECNTERCYIESLSIALGPIPVPFLGIDHHKSNFSLISDTLSVGGCGGQPMLLFWKLVDETQISKPPEPTMNHNSIKWLILLPLRAELLFTLQYEIPCKCHMFHKSFDIRFKVIEIASR